MRLPVVQRSRHCLCSFLLSNLRLVTWHATPILKYSCSGGHMFLANSAKAICVLRLLVLNPLFDLITMRTTCLQIGVES